MFRLWSIPPRCETLVATGVLAEKSIRSKGHNHIQIATSTFRPSIIPPNKSLAITMGKTHLRIRHNWDLCLMRGLIDPFMPVVTGINGMTASNIRQGLNLCVLRKGQRHTSRHRFLSYLAPTPRNPRLASVSHMPEVKAQPAWESGMGCTIGASFDYCEIAPQFDYQHICSIFRRLAKHVNSADRNSPWT